MILSTSVTEGFESDPQQKWFFYACMTAFYSAVLATTECRTGQGKSNLLGDSSSSTAILPPDSAFSTERNVPFLFILAYEEGKVNENMLLFEVARYNFSTFLHLQLQPSPALSVCCELHSVQQFYNETQQYFPSNYMQIPKWRHRPASPEITDKLEQGLELFKSERFKELYLKTDVQVLQLLV